MAMFIYRVILNISCKHRDLLCVEVANNVCLEHVHPKCLYTLYALKCNLMVRNLRALLFFPWKGSRQHVSDDNNVQIFEWCFLFKYTTFCERMTLVILYADDFKTTKSTIVFDTQQNMFLSLISQNIKNKSPFQKLYLVCNMDRQIKSTAEV